MVYCKVRDPETSPASRPDNVYFSDSLRPVPGLGVTPMKFPNILVLALVLLLLAVLASCASQPLADAYDPPGFILAIFHGAVAPFALIGSLFTDIRIYAFPNSGFFYDLGYLGGLGLGLLLWASSGG